MKAAQGRVIALSQSFLAMFRLLAGGTVALLKRDREFAEILDRAKDHLHR